MCEQPNDPISQQRIIDKLNRIGSVDLEGENQIWKNNRISEWQDPQRLRNIRSFRRRIGFSGLPHWKNGFYDRVLSRWRLRFWRILVWFLVSQFESPPVWSV